MNLALADIFKAKWSQQIHKEWIEAVLRHRPDLKRSQLERTQRLMDMHVQDAVVENYEGLIQNLSLPDLDDRHVLAAAIQGKADVIVTFNIRDFPHQILSIYNLKAQHPDNFILRLFGMKPFEIIAAAFEHRRSLKNPPKKADDYLSTLEQVGLTQTVTALQSYKQLI